MKNKNVTDLFSQRAMRIYKYKIENQLVFEKSTQTLELEDEQQYINNKKIQTSPNLENQLQFVTNSSLKIVAINEKFDTSIHFLTEEKNFNSSSNTPQVMPQNTEQIDIALKQPHKEIYSTVQQEKNNNSPLYPNINDNLSSDVQKEIIVNQQIFKDHDKESESQIQDTQQQLFNQICQQNQQVHEKLILDQQQVFQNPKKQKIILRFLFKQQQIDQKSNQNNQTIQQNQKITNEKIQLFDEKQLRKRKKSEQKIQKQQQQIQINNERSQEEYFDNKASTSTANKSRRHQKVSFFLLSALSPEKFKEYQYHLQMVKKIKYSLIGDVQNDSTQCNLCISKFKRQQELIVHWKKRHLKEFKQLLPQYEI